MGDGTKKGRGQQLGEYQLVVFVGPATICFLKFRAWDIIFMLAITLDRLLPPCADHENVWQGFRKSKRLKPSCHFVFMLTFCESTLCCVTAAAVGEEARMCN